MQPSRPRVTISDIARLVDVAPSTVSNALSGARYVDAAIAGRVRKAALELGYTPNLIARRLRSGRSNTVGLLSSMPFGVAGGSSRLGFMMEIAAAAAQSALECGHALTLLPPVEAGRTLISDVILDGALIIEPSADDPFVADLQARALPMVAIGKLPEGGKHLHVDLRAHETAAMLMDHLVDAGAKRIALLTGTARRTSYIEMEDVYARRMKAPGCRAMALRIDEAGGEEAAFAAVKKLLNAHRDVDAIIAFVDAFATGACRAVQAQGLSIPGDVKIVTRYDGPRARENDPPLTAIDLGLAAVAREAVELLLGAINGESRAVRSVTGPAPRLIVRASSLRTAQ